VVRLSRTDKMGVGIEKSSESERRKESEKLDSSLKEIQVWTDVFRGSLPLEKAKELVLKGRAKVISAEAIELLPISEEKED